MKETPIRLLRGIILGPFPVSGNRLTTAAIAGTEMATLPLAAHLFLVSCQERVNVLFEHRG